MSHGFAPDTPLYPIATPGASTCPGCRLDLSLQKGTTILDRPTMAFIHVDERPSLCREISGSEATRIGAKLVPNWDEKGCTRCYSD